MKTIIAWLLPIIVLFQAAAPAPVPVEQEPRHVVKFENQYLRVIDASLPPGDATLFHTHARDNIPVTISGGELKSELLGGQPVASTTAIGTATFAKASYTHRVTNTGETALRFIRDVVPFNSTS